MNTDLKTLLNPRDRKILDAETGTNWIPQNPREVLLPYFEESVDRDTIEFRVKKALEVYNGYTTLISTCKELEQEIDKQCKNVEVPLEESKHFSLMTSVKRVFGTDGTKISYEMYKMCIQKLAEIGDSNIPTPEGK